MVKGAILKGGRRIQGLFTRKLKGGLVHSKKELYVPESICR